MGEGVSQLRMSKEHTSDSHGNANISTLQCGRIVHSITSHSHDIVLST
jgi:hypothetical protein